MPLPRWWPLRRVLVTGPSMAPAYKHGDHLLVVLRPPRRLPPIGSAVLARLPDGTLAVKRLTRVEPDERVWLEGDNPLGSTDSRTFGALPAAAIEGRVLLRIRRRKGLGAV